MTARGGERRYELVQGWGQLPSGWEWGQVSAVGVDSDDQVHILNRTEHPYTVLDRDGRVVYSWGQGILEDPHGICITPDDDVIIIEREPQVVLKFSKEGRHLLTLGRKNEASDTGFTREDPHVSRPGDPFNYPTDACVSPTGDIYVSDGYRNCRVHKFAPDGSLLFSWGEPGEGPGQFRLVHSVWEYGSRVYVADRQNNRIQIFSTDGSYLDTWTGFLQPAKIYIDAAGVVYVAELGARVSILDLEGNLLCRLGGERRSHEPGEFFGPHGIWADSIGDLYVSETLDGRRVQKFARVK